MSQVPNCGDNCSKVNFILFFEKRPPITLPPISPPPKSPPNPPIILLPKSPPNPPILILPPKSPPKSIPCFDCDDCDDCDEIFLMNDELEDEPRGGGGSGLSGLEKGIHPAPCIFGRLGGGGCGGGSRTGLGIHRAPLIFRRLGVKFTAVINNSCYLDTYI